MKLDNNFSSSLARLGPRQDEPGVPTMRPGAFEEQVAHVERLIADSQKPRWLVPASEGSPAERVAKPAKQADAPAGSSEPPAALHAEQRSAASGEGKLSGVDYGAGCMADAFTVQLCMGCGKNLGKYNFGASARRTCGNETCESIWIEMTIAAGIL